MKYIAHEQGSAAWHAWRATGIGASDAAAILGISPWKTRAVLLAEMIGLAVPDAPNYAMRRGTRREDEARRVYEQMFDMSVQPACGQHDEHDWIRASLDGITFDESLILEIKWPNAKAHELALEGYVPDYYWPQIQQQLLVTGAAVCHYWSCSDTARFDLDQRYALVEVRPDGEYAKFLIDELDKFWREVQEQRRTA